MQGSSQRQILKGIRKGQRQAYEEVICQHYSAIYRFLAYLTKDRNAAEDLTQETFAGAWANLGGYKGRSLLKTWLHRIAYHKFIDSKRKLESDANLAAGLKQRGPDASGKHDPLQRVVCSEQLQFLYEAMGKLEPAEYLVIVLHYVQGLSFGEMAKVVGEPVGTVKWRTNKALKRLKTFLVGRVR